jgi:hypothetical protein
VKVTLAKVGKVWWRDAPTLVFIFKENSFTKGDVWIQNPLVRQKI